MGAAFSVKSLNWAAIEVRNPTLDSCIGERYAECFSPRNGRSSSQLAILRVIIILPSDLVLVNVLSVTLSVTLEIRKKKNSRNSAKDVTERSVQEFSHVLSNLCEPVIS